MAHIEAAPNIGQCFASLTAKPGFGDLVLGELGLPAEPDASRLCACTPITGPRQNERSLEFSEPAQNRDHELAVWGRCVGPWITERSKPGALVAYGHQRV